MERKAAGGVERESTKVLAWQRACTLPSPDLQQRPAPPPQRLHSTNTSSPDGVSKENTTRTATSPSNPERILSFRSGGGRGWEVEVHGCASKKESSALGRCRHRAGPAGQGFPPDPYQNHQQPEHAGDDDRGRRTARRTGGVGRRRGVEAVPTDLGPDLGGEKRCDHRLPTPCRPSDQGDVPQHLRLAPAAQTPSPHRTGPPPRSPQPPARSTERLDPRRHRHRRPRGLARRPPRVATREGEGKEKVAARARVSPRCRPGATRERRGGGGILTISYFNASKQLKSIKLST